MRRRRPHVKMAELRSSSVTRQASRTQPDRLGIGMALGIAIRRAADPDPLRQNFSIGSAAARAIVGLIFDASARIGPSRQLLPFTTCQVMAELGCCWSSFLRVLGPARRNIGRLVYIFALGLVMTSIMAIGLYCRWVFKMGGTEARRSARWCSDPARRPRIRERPYQR